MTATRLRRGLPRSRGGEPWPPAPEGAGAAAAAVVEEAVVAEAGLVPSPEAGVAERPVAGSPAGAPVRPAAAAPASPGAPGLRRGLPRVRGGAPWPEAGAAAPVAVAAPAAPPAEPPASAAGPPATAQPAAAAPEPSAAPRPSVPAPAAGAGGPLSRAGLPRTAGGPPWPSPRPVPAAYLLRAAAPPVGTAVPAEEPAAASAEAPAAAGAVPSRPERKRRRPVAALRGRYQALGAPQRAAVLAGGAVALVLAALLVVLVARWLVALDPVRGFIAEYHGQYELPEWAPEGIPAWLGWQHFFNAFFLALIIRTGWQVRTQKRPAAFWTSRRPGGRKVSLTLWLHQSLDLLWLVNGVVFVVLLVATGQWVRIVPTSWEVFPNAVSAGLQYASLNWPTENGWVNYNSLQQLTYFTTVFIAAPLAAATGFRMSTVWPQGNERLSRAYPIEIARAVHFPVMLYFVVFIVIHVALVLATGALRNLNHMYGGQDAINWTGFAVFAGSLVVIAAAWIAARPLVVAPIASLFGKVGR